MITIDYNPSVRKLQIIPEDKDVFNNLREAFSVKNEGKRFAKGRQKYIQDRKYIISPMGTCLPGLHREIESYLHQQQITNIQHTDRFLEYINCGADYNVYNNLKLRLRYYQEEFIGRGLKSGNGICIVGTGGGKTLICASLIQSYYENCNDKQKFKCLLIVPTIDLVKQTYSDFEEYGTTFTMTKWTGSHDLDLNVNVIICNSAIVVRRFEVNKWIQDVNLVLIDEVHTLSDANKITKVVSKIKTHNKYGFTGTLPNELFTRWSIIGTIGPIIYEKSSDELRKEDYLVNVEVNRLEIEYNTQIKKLTDNDYYNELDFIYHNQYRNNIIKSICKKYNKNILILVNHIRHGEKLLNVLQNLDRPVYFIQGNVEVEDRFKVIQQIETEEGVILIAMSKIFSTGLNIKNLHMLMFVSGGKAFIRTVQAIGRGLRKHSSKTVFNIIDLCDNLQYSSEHAQRRIEIYDKEKIKHKTKKLKEHG